MHTNPLLEEIWETRRRLLEEAGGDLATLAEQSRKWAETQDLPNRVKHEDLREFFKRQKETTIASYLVARPSRDLVLAAPHPGPRLVMWGGAFASRSRTSSGSMNS